MRSGDGEVCDFPRQPAVGVWFVHPRVFNSHIYIYIYICIYIYIYTLFLIYHSINQMNRYKHGVQTWFYQQYLPWFKQTQEARCYDSQLAMGGTMENWQWVKTLVPSEPQNSWDLWMFIPQKMVLIGIDPYPTPRSEPAKLCVFTLQERIGHGPIVARSTRPRKKISVSVVDWLT